MTTVAAISAVNAPVQVDEDQRIVDSKEASLTYHCDLEGYIGLSNYAYSLSLVAIALCMSAPRSSVESAFAQEITRLLQVTGRVSTQGIFSGVIL
jgi:hypothetical protein